MLMQNVHCLFWNSYLMAYWPNRCVEMIFNFLPNKIYWFFYILWCFNIIEERFFQGTPNLARRCGMARAAAEVRCYFRPKANPRFYKRSSQVMEIWSYFHPKWTDSGPKCHSFSEGRYFFPPSAYDLVIWRLAVRGGSPADGSGARCRANAVLIKFAGGAGELRPNQNVRRSLVRTIM